VLEFIVDGESGVVTSLEPSALATAIDQVADVGFARELGAAGPARVAQLTWDTVADALLAG
jgi:glycosyltransferase involved in cell wall biosynthesis